MAQVRRNDIEQADAPSGHAAPYHGHAPAGYDPRGPVAQLQNDLAIRLAAGSAAWAPLTVPSPVERWVHLTSVAGGYAALAAGYVAITSAVLRWA